MIAHLKRQFETTGGSDCYSLKILIFKQADTSGKLQCEISQRKEYHYVKSVRIELFCFAFSRIRNEYGEILSTYLVRMRENTDLNNSEYGYFLRSV